MTADIVDRLRDPKYDCSEEAADEIERLREQVAQLSARLAELDPYPDEKRKIDKDGWDGHEYRE